MPASAHFVDLALFPAHLRGIVEGMISVHDQAVSDLTERNAALSTQNTELEAVNARLEHMAKELNQLVYGKRSERLSEDERQLAFEDLEAAGVQAEAQAEEIDEPSSTPRRQNPQPSRRNLGHLRGHLELIEQLIAPDSITCPCGCGEMVQGSL